jgi:hypothetical protein
MNSRSLARRHLNPEEIPLTFTSFPRLGVPGQFTEPYFDPSDAVSSHSLFLPQEITNPHARFPSALHVYLSLRTSYLIFTAVLSRQTSGLGEVPK